jgi:hypothetical protein
MFGRFQGIRRGFVTVIDSRNRKFLFAELLPNRLYGPHSADVCEIPPTFPEYPIRMLLRLLNPSSHHK